MTSRKFLTVIPLALFLLWQHCAFALSWQDLWYTQDQQAALAMKKLQFTVAAEKFNNALWKGIAYYRAGNYDYAEQVFAQFNTPITNFNRGNALAQMGKYPEAINAYNQVLQQQPSFTDAKCNKELLEKLLKQPPSQKPPSSGQGKDNNTKVQNGSPGATQQTVNDQELQQWLQQIPDNPGGLLKQKFLRDHQRSIEEKTL